MSQAPSTLARRESVRNKAPASEKKSKSKAATTPLDDIQDDASVDQMLSYLASLASDMGEGEQLHVIHNTIFAYANHEDSVNFKDSKTVIKKSDFIVRFVTHNIGERQHRLALFRTELHPQRGNRSWFLAMILKHPHPNHGDILVVWDPNLSDEDRDKDGYFAEQSLFHHVFSKETFTRVSRNILNIRGVMGDSYGEMWAGGTGVTELGHSNARLVIEKAAEICRLRWEGFDSTQLINLGFERVDFKDKHVLIDW
jgi:hypothetical protein